MFDLTGKTLGKYRLLEKLGHGGMAQVYKAYQPDLDQYVAIKILHPHLTGDAGFGTRFRREARAIAALEHPHIVRVYDFETDEDLGEFPRHPPPHLPGKQEGAEGQVSRTGLAFLVMEYLEGTGLKKRLHDLDCREELMPLEEVAGLFDALTSALDHAHQQGIVHRDLKPANVLVTTDGRPVLTDFGIARIVDATAITESGGTLGTPAYMSPEQGQGEPGDARSDIYALGVLLYQLCTGRVPFDADTPYAIILKHITAPLPPPRSIRPELPEAVERVILKALAKGPDDRYQTAGELGRAFRVALESPQAAPPPSRRSVTLRNAAPVGVAIVAGLALLLLTRPWWRQRFLARSTPTPVFERVPATLVLQGPDVVDDTWLDPDLPDKVWHETDLVHLQGPLTPDRLLLRFDLSGRPAEAAATVVSATLTLRVELWGEQSFPGAAVVYRVLTPWEPDTATYNAPWSAPGLVAGVDYDLTPLDLAPVPDVGWLTFDVGRAVIAWHERGEPNCGLVVMMSEDSHNQAHHWVYLSEQTNPADRPTLRVVYEVAP